MINKLNLEIFTFLPKYKYLKRSYLNVGPKEVIFLAKMYFKYKVYKKYSWKEWKNGMIMYCIDNMLTWDKAVQKLIEEKII